MAYEQAASGLLAGIDKALAQLEAQAKELQAATPYGSAQRGAAAPAAAGAPSLDDMALTISRLKQIKILYPQNKREKLMLHTAADKGQNPSRVVCKETLDALHFLAPIDRQKDDSLDL